MTKLWIAITFQPLGSNDPAIFHGAFSNVDSALRALRYEDLLGDGCGLVEHDEVVSIVSGDDVYVAQAFSVNVNEQVRVDI